MSAWVGLLIPVLWFAPVLVACGWREREWLKLVDARAWRVGAESPYDEIRNARTDWNVIRVIQIKWRERGRLTEPDVDPKVEQRRLRVRLAGRFLTGWIFFGLFPIAAVLSLPASAVAILNGGPASKPPAHSSHPSTSDRHNHHPHGVCINRLNPPPLSNDGAPSARDSSAWLQTTDGYHDSHA